MARAPVCLCWDNSDLIVLRSEGKVHVFVGELIDLIMDSTSQIFDIDIDYQIIFFCVQYVKYIFSKQVENIGSKCSTSFSVQFRAVHLDNKIPGDRQQQI